MMINSEVSFWSMTISLKRSRCATSRQADPQQKTSHGRTALEILTSSDAVEDGRALRDDHNPHGSGCWTILGSFESPDLMVNCEHFCVPPIRPLGASRSLLAPRSVHIGVVTFDLHDVPDFHKYHKCPWISTDIHKLYISMIYIIPVPWDYICSIFQPLGGKLGRQNTNRRLDNAKQIELLLSSRLMIQSASEHSENSHSRGYSCTEPVSERLWSFSFSAIVCRGFAFVWRRITSYKPLFSACGEWLPFLAVGQRSPSFLSSGCLFLPQFRIWSELVGNHWNTRKHPMCSHHFQEFHGFVREFVVKPGEDHTQCQDPRCHHLGHGFEHHSS